MVQIARSWFTIRALLHAQLFVLKHPFGGISIFIPCDKPKTLVEYSNSLSIKILLKLLTHLHNFIHLSQAVLILVHYHQGILPFTGNNQIQLAYWFLVAIGGSIIYSFVATKASELVVIINTLFILPEISNSKIIKAFMSLQPIVSILVTILHGILVFHSEYEPISWTFGLNAGKISLRTFLDLYATWNFGAVVTLGCFALYNGFFSSYLALWEISTNLLNLVKSRVGRYIGASKCFPKMLKRYRQLEVYTSVVNDCFQNSLALPFKAGILLTAVFLGTVVVLPEFRLSTGITFQIAGLFTLAVIYLYMGLGYFFPGKGNLTSRLILLNWISIISRDMWLERSQRKLFKLMLEACQPVKIRFGSVNYYEMGTTLALVDFLIDRTISLVLMVYN